MAVGHGDQVEGRGHGVGVDAFVPILRSSINIDIDIDSQTTAERGRPIRSQVPSAKHNTDHRLPAQLHPPPSPPKTQPNPRFAALSSGQTLPPSKMPNLECRMYEQRFPEVDAAVMIQVKHIADMGAYVSLLEYNNIEGMILFSELSRRRIRSISSLIKVGRQEPAIVLRVDRDKGYIDLSKRRVSEEEAHACEDRYNKSKLVHSIMRHVAETLEIDLEPLYQRIGWPLYRKYGHAFEAFKLIVADPDAILDALTYEEKEVGPDGQEVNSVFLSNCKLHFDPAAHVMDEQPSRLILLLVLGCA